MPGTGMFGRRVGLFSGSGASSSTATRAIGEMSRRPTVLTSRDGTSFTEAAGDRASSEAAPVV